MKTLNWKSGLIVAGLLLAGPAAAWEEGVIVDFGGQSYEGWSGILAPSAPEAGTAICWPFTPDGGDCGPHVADRDAARAASAERGRPADVRAPNRVAREASPAASAAR